MLVQIFEARCGAMRKSPAPRRRGIDVDFTDHQTILTNDITVLVDIDSNLPSKVGSVAKTIEDQRHHA